MIRIARTFLSLLIISGSAACAVPAVEPAPEPAPRPELALLDSASVRADLDVLIRSQATRTSADAELIRRWHAYPVVAWNEQARYWVSYYGLDPVVASRVYALTSVAQQRALDALASSGIDSASRKPTALDGRIESIPMAVDPFESAVLIGAAEPVFLYLFPETPNEIAAIFDEARQSLLISGGILPGDLVVLEGFGAAIAQDLIAERMDDGASKAQEFDLLLFGEGIWVNDPYRRQPEQPGWGIVTPWLMDTPDQFRAPPPPAFGSSAFQSALDEVRIQQEHNTPGQLAIAQNWADKRFTYTPPGHWNVIAADLTMRYSLSDREASQVFAALNMAQMDAGIACWDSKYHYMVVRPWQADPRIAGLVGYPNHPSYPSGHSCFSSAAAVTLGYFFPAEEDALWHMAEEASISRFYGGIHYLFDLDAGQELGRQVGELAKLYPVEQRGDLSTP